MAKGFTAFKSPVKGLHYVLPASLLPLEEQIAGWVDERVEQFETVCGEYREASKIETVKATARVKVIDDYVFRCAGPSGLCAGLYVSRTNTKVILYNKINAATLEECVAAGSYKVRTRQEVYKLSGRNPHWLEHPANFFCGNTADPLPSLVHELCHNFGRYVGHQVGKGECEP